MSRHRLFVALRPPPAVRAHLLGLMGGVAAARWQDEEQLHCTLRFLGEIDRRAAEDVAEALLALRHPPVDAVLEGLGTFDKAGRVDTLWAGLGPAAALRALHVKVDRLVRGAGAAADERAYRPHVTLARFARGDGVRPDVVAAVSPPAPLAMRFEDVRLCESVLGRDGARYETVARYPLRG